VKVGQATNGLALPLTTLGFTKMNDQNKGKTAKFSWQAGRASGKASGESSASFKTYVGGSLVFRRKQKMKSLFRDQLKVLLDPAHEIAKQPLSDTCRDLSIVRHYRDHAVFDAESHERSHYRIWADIATEIATKNILPGCFDYQRRVSVGSHFPQLFHEPFSVASNATQKVVETLALDADQIFETFHGVVADCQRRDFNFVLWELPRGLFTTILYDRKGQRHDERITSP
jgi:hypothetical protein